MAGDEREPLSVYISNRKRGFTWRRAWEGSRGLVANLEKFWITECYMAWIFSLASAASQKHSASGCGQSPTVSVTDSLKVSCLAEWLRDNCQPLPSGMTSPHSEAQCSPQELTSSTGVSPAKTYPLPASELAWVESEAALSAKSGDWLMRYDHASSSWRTCQLSLMEDWIKFSVRLPNAGMMLGGYVYPQPKWEPATFATDGGYLPTPTIDGNYNRKGASKKAGDGLYTTLMRMIPTPTARDWKDGTAQSCANVPVNGLLVRAIHTLKTPTRRDARKGDSVRLTESRYDLADQLGGRLSPLFVEALMGYPINWTKVDILPPKKGRR